MANPVEYRGKGIGKALTIACIEYAKKSNAKTIGLHTRLIMEIALVMYQRMGFEKFIISTRFSGWNMGCIN